MDPESVRERAVWRLEGGGPVRADRDSLAAEEPLEIRVRGRSVSVTMRTPGHDRELAAGFLVTEGVVASAADIVRIEPCAGRDNVVNATLGPEVRVDFDSLTRHVFASSSCGLCGKATIDAIHRRLDPVGSDVVVDADMLAALPDMLRGEQLAFDRTGGLHACAVFDASGALIAAREDVGRHNAVDKVVGNGLLNGRLPFDRHVMMISGRASFEIMLKALAARVPVVAAVSAPSALAAEFADRSGQTLVGFLRDHRMNVYAHPERIVSDQPDQ